MRNLEIVNTSTKHTPPEGALDAITEAIEAQLHQLARSWGEYVWTVVDVANARGFKIVLVDNPDVSGALGYHDVTPDGQPYARVFLDPIFDHGGAWIRPTSSTIVLSVAEVASHEVCELIGDPGANRWANDANGVFWALELCDAVEACSYDVTVSVKGQGPIRVAVSDFLLPEYFNPLAKVGPFSFANNVAAPFELAAGGYAIRAAAGKVSQVFGTEYPEWKVSTKVAGSRTAARTRFASLIVSTVDADTAGA